MKPTVFIPEPIALSGLELLEAACRCLAPWKGSDPSEGDPLAQADAVVVRLFRMDEEAIRRAGKLKVIAKHGVGLDNIDLRAATRAGIPVVYTPTANANAVAEHTIALMLALSRQVAPADAATREGHFGDRAMFQGVELAGKTLGVIGLGRIGSRVARIAETGLGMEVLAYDPYLRAEKETGPARLVETLEAVIRPADFLTLHVSLTPDTRHLIDAQTLNWVRPGARIINTSRGAVIDETALLAALTEGHLAGAALDVFEEEPLPADHPLLQAPNTLLTPHISSSTVESLARMSQQAAQGVLDVLDGRVPAYPVNPEALE